MDGDVFDSRDNYEANMYRPFSSLRDVAVRIGGFCGEALWSDGLIRGIFWHAK